MIRPIIKWTLILTVFSISAIASGYIVLQWVIKSEDVVVVPELTHRQVVYVLEILSDLGLNTRVERTEFNDSVAAHHVVSQDPTAGTEIKRGRDVRLVISKGPAMVRMPNLSGLRRAQAEVIIEEAGLCGGTVARTYSERVEDERVVAQNPEPGLRIDRARCVQLLVSAGPTQAATVMPKLWGRSLSDAILLADAAELAVAPPTYQIDGRHPVHHVLFQQPPAGTRVIRGAVVALVVNSRDGKRGSEFGRGNADQGLIRYRAPSGFLKQHVLVQLVMKEITVDLFNGFMAPNDELWFYRPKLPDTRLTIIADGEPVLPMHQQ